MTDAIDRNWQSRWAFIDEFLSRWTAADFVRSPDAELIASYERAMGVRLPPSLQEWCYFAQAVRQFRGHIEFRDAVDLGRLEGSDQIVLVTLVEGDFAWSVAEAALTEDDPPVAGFGYDHFARRPRFESRGIWAPSVAAFALDLVLSNVKARGGRCSTASSSPAFDRHQLAEDFAAPCKLGHVEVWLRSDCLAYRAIGNNTEQDDAIHVLVHETMPMDQLPRSVRALWAASHVRRGPLAQTRE